MTKPPAAFTAQDVTKSYGGRPALTDLTLQVEVGETVGILGNNGAGKTTALELFAGLRSPDSGLIEVFGLDPRRRQDEIRQVLGVQLQQANLHGALTVGELVTLYRSFYPNPRSRDELLDMVGLRENRHTRFEKLSGGQQQRVSIALALAGRPRAVILDELTTGLDPRARRHMWDTIEQLKDEGVSVLLVSHTMEEVARLCDRIALLDAGRVIATGTPGAVIEQAHATTLDDAFVALVGREAGAHE
ncbi:ABC transporter ATP-binding protein [Microbacterium gorillae]|uniref:ABC transporter ATP-binding protein n=1 Tax=Microbacterium gorillae TaxID=1231063 RepID=UPI003D96B6ED